MDYIESTIIIIDYVLLLWSVAIQCISVFASAACRLNCSRLFRHLIRS